MFGSSALRIGKTTYPYLSIGEELMMLNQAYSANPNVGATLDTYVILGFLTTARPAKRAENGVVNGVDYAYWEGTAYYPWIQGASVKAKCFLLCYVRSYVVDRSSDGDFYLRELPPKTQTLRPVVVRLFAVYKAGCEAHVSLIPAETDKKHLISLVRAQAARLAAEADKQAAEAAQQKVLLAEWHRVISGLISELYDYSMNHISSIKGFQTRIQDYAKASDGEGLANYLEGIREAWELDCHTLTRPAFRQFYPLLLAYSGELEHAMF